MTSKMVNGLLFISGGLAPIVLYLALGPEGADILDAKLTENLVFWIMLSIPIAFMMTASTMKDGPGSIYAKVGLLIFVIAYAGGSVGDAVFASGNEQLGEAIQDPFWAGMMLAFAITAVGYYLQKNFPVWLSGLMALAGVYGFIAIAFIDLNANEALELHLWLGFTGILILLGVFTILKKE